MTSAPTFKLTVVVGTLNRLDCLRDCIQSIQQASISTMIHVTDAGSTDGTQDFLHGVQSDNIAITLHPSRIGQARAYNEIFRHIESPFTCWLSDDNVIVNNSLDTAVRILESHPTIGMIGLKVKDVQGPFAQEPYVGGISELGILNVNQGVLRTSLLKELGGFSEEFMDYGIDPDLTARVLLSGHDVALTKEVAVLHRRDWGDADALASQMAKQMKYQQLYRQKYEIENSGRQPSRVKSRVLGAARRVALKLARMFGSDRGEQWSRDIYNIALGKHISLLDPILCIGEDFHLLQHCDRSTLEYFATRQHLWQ